MELKNLTHISCGSVVEAWQEKAVSRTSNPCLRCTVRAQRSICSRTVEPLSREDEELLLLFLDGEIAHPTTGATCSASSPAGLQPRWNVVLLRTRHGRFPRFSVDRCFAQTESWLVPTGLDCTDTSLILQPDRGRLTISARPGSPRHYRGSFCSWFQGGRLLFIGLWY